MPTTLFEVNQYRQKKHLMYEAKDILQLLYDLTSVCAYLQKKGTAHGLIKPEYVAIDPEGHYVLCDHMIDGDNIDVNVHDYKVSESNHYQGPLLWNDLSEKKDVLYDPFKNDVFSAGLVLLECCVIDDELYGKLKGIHKKNGELDYE